MKEIIVPVVYNTVDRCGRKEITDALKQANVSRVFIGFGQYFYDEKTSGIL